MAFIFNDTTTSEIYTLSLHDALPIYWHRNYFFESTGIKWIPPSPNLRTIKGSIVYPGIEILQSAGVSVGRGTRSEEHTSELQSLRHLVCRLLLEKKTKLRDAIARLDC